MTSLTVLITGYETIGDHIEYVIQLSCSGIVWLVSRRYNDFDQFHFRLSHRFGSALTISLPVKQWFGR